MKKIISMTVIALLALTQFSKAQSPAFHLGIKAGASMNKLEGKSFKDEFTFGYQAGLFAELNFSKRIGIQPEVIWNESTVRTSDKFSDIYEDITLSTVTKVKLNYLTIPLLLNYRPSKFLTLQAGPQYGILVNKDKDLLENGKDAFKNGEFSVLGGVNLKIASFRIYGRYVIGLNDINDIDNRDSWKNQAFQVGVGYAIW